uniref:Uncharacterized protein n=1 Tax=Trypanosoma vivax (strain Y486) TaxID=1055687 RepID=G0U7K2_TRYVY|nr:hypothetical protein TVY486_1009050 [Trypanosoma vivax Y486]
MQVHAANRFFTGSILGTLLSWLSIGMHRCVSLCFVHKNRRLWCVYRWRCATPHPLLLLLTGKHFHCKWVERVVVVVVEGFLLLLPQLLLFTIALTPTGALRNLS